MIATYRFAVGSAPVAIGAGPGIFYLRVIEYETPILVGERTAVADTGYPLLVGVDYRFELADGDELWAVSRFGEAPSKVALLIYRAP